MQVCEGAWPGCARIPHAGSRLLISVLPSPAGRGAPHFCGQRPMRGLHSPAPGRAPSPPPAGSGAAPRGQWGDNGAEGSPRPKGGGGRRPSQGNQGDASPERKGRGGWQAAAGRRAAQRCVLRRAARRAVCSHSRPRWLRGGRERHRRRPRAAAVVLRGRIKPESPHQTARWLNDTAPDPTDRGVLGVERPFSAVLPPYPDGDDGLGRAASGSGRARRWLMGRHPLVTRELSVRRAPLRPPLAPLPTRALRSRPPMAGRAQRWSWRLAAGGWRRRLAAGWFADGMGCCSRRLEGQASRHAWLWLIVWGSANRFNLESPQLPSPTSSSSQRTAARS